MKTLAKIALILLPLVTIAQNNPDKTFVETIALETSPETAWSALTDFSNFNSWDSNVVAVRCPEDVKNNQVCQMISNTGELIDVELVELVENEFYIIRYKLSSGNFYIKRSIESTDLVTITETAWFTGISKKTFEKYKGEDYASLMKNRMKTFKLYLEEDYGK